MLVVWWKKSTSEGFPKNKQVESSWFVYFLREILTQSLQNAVNFANKMKEMQIGRWVCQEANTLHNSRHRLHQNFDKNKKSPKCAKVQFLWAAQTRYWYIMALQRGSSHDLMATISEIESSILPAPNCVSRVIHQKPKLGMQANTRSIQQTILRLIQHKKWLQNTWKRRFLQNLDVART